MYDFHKCKRSTQDISFQHPFFVRGREDLLIRIKRKTNSSYIDVHKQQAQMHLMERKAIIEPTVQQKLMSF